MSTTTNTHRTTTTELGFHVGDIIFWDNGYTMQLPNFARITKLTPCSAIAEMLQAAETPSDGYGTAGTQMPLVNQPTGKIIKLRVHHNAWLCTTGEYGNPVKLWDGQPKSYDYLD